MLITAAIDARLAEICRAEHVLQDPSECWVYGYDNSRGHALPERVIFPERHEQIVAIMNVCIDHNIPLVVRGRGTGTTGATIPTAGGIVLSTERMNRIIKVDPDNRSMIVEPGVTNQQVQDEAAKVGFFWPPDPTSAAFCSVGGNLAYNSAGPRAVKYGTCRENVLGLRAVTGRGKELRTGVHTTKGVVGYDLTRLLIGSEGTLAIITEATLKLTPLPETKRTMRATYTDVRSATAAIVRIMAQPVTPCALEFMDSLAINMIRKHTQVELPKDAGALLIIEVDGLHTDIDAIAQLIAIAAQNDGLMELKIADTPTAVKELWDTRKALSPALRNVAPKKINEDVVVPVSHLPELIEGLTELATHHRITIVNFGHAGNGNIHVNLLVNPDDSAEMDRAKKCLAGTFALVLRLQGTLSGEHGIGLEKRDFIAQELSSEALAVMREIKQVFDPSNILNPGKLLPP